MKSSMRVPAYILAGGESRRFGSDKARATLDDTPLVRDVADTLVSACAPITIVARTEGEYEDLGLATIGDLIPGRGPAGGILTALSHAVRTGGEGWVFVAACDWVGVRAGWVDDLLAAKSNGVRAVVFEGDRIEPLFAIYHTSARDLIGRAVDADRVRMQDILLDLPVTRLPVPEGWHTARNVNRRHDLPNVRRPPSRSGGGDA